MKTIAFIFACFAFATRGCSQNISQTQVPSVVNNTFEQKYPQAADVEWEKHGMLYNVEFEISNIDHELWIDEKGTITKHKEDISLNDLPKEVQDAINNNYKATQVDDIDKIEEQQKVYYLVEFDNWSGDKYVSFNPDGTVFKK